MFFFLGVYYELLKHFQITMKVSFKPKIILSASASVYQFKRKHGVLSNGTLEIFCPFSSVEEKG